MRVGIAAGIKDGTTTTYRVTVRTAGSPVVLVLPFEARFAKLIVNGTLVRYAGRDSDIGSQPFGHGTPSLLLANLTPRDRVTIAIIGSDRPPLIVANVGRIASAFRSGLGSGIFYGILASIVLFQIFAIFAIKDPTLFWYVGWVASVAGIELARDDLLGLSWAASENAILTANVAALVCFVGFFCTYLRLRSTAPRLFWLFVAINAAAIASPAVDSIVTQTSPTLKFVFLANSIPILFGMVIATVRSRAGFTPATFVLYGLFGTAFIFIGRLFRDYTGIESPFLDRWSIELGSTFDFCVFSLGLAYRSRFMHREREHMEDDLREASFAAGHDPLTALLNRRGLEEWLRLRGRFSGTVLFMDIDGFKEVNDLGGHAAGDDTLSSVARIVRNCIRTEDVVARFGGDEFVAILNGCKDAATSAGIAARISSGVGFLLPLGTESSLHISLSIGSALVNGNTSFAQALKDADADAYRMKAEHHARSRKPRRTADAALPRA
jgi:diguanylate cyclase (GGDEF)-like protein